MEAERDDGLEVLQRIREGSDADIVVMTAHESRRFRAKYGLEVPEQGRNQATPECVCNAYTASDAYEGWNMDSMSTRIHAWLRDEIVRFGRTQRAGPSEALRRVAEEWWALQHFPAIEFREGVTGRRAALRAGPDVWEVVMVWKEYEPDRDGLRAHFGDVISPDQLDQALAYYERFPEEVEERLEDNRRVAAQLEARFGAG